jgi:phosphotransferase system enzyme I (PtsP)
LQQIVDAGKAANVPVSLCGELASEPAGALLLMAMGYDTLSMNAAGLPKVKSALRNFTMQQAKAMLQQALLQANSAQVEVLVNEAMEAAGLNRLHSHGVKLKEKS